MERAATCLSMQAGPGKGDCLEQARKEFEKRAGFALAAFLAVHDKRAGNGAFQKFLQAIERGLGRAKFLSGRQ